MQVQTILKIDGFVTELFNIGSGRTQYLRACFILNNGGSRYSCQEIRAVWVNQLISKQQFAERLKQSCRHRTEKKRVTDGG